MTTNLTISNEKYVEKKDSAFENTLVNEISFIKAQTEQMVLMNSIEIGRRLCEAKKLIKHGEWGNWLKERVSFSQRTASTLMSIYKEYGQNGLAQNSSAVQNLSYTQALALLAVPAEEREEFIEENDISKKTIKELKETIKKISSENTAKDKELTAIKAKSEKEISALKSEKDALTKAGQDKEASIDLLSKRIEELHAEKEAAEKNMDAELQKRIATSISENQDKITFLEKEKADLTEKLAEIETAHADAIKKSNEQMSARIKEIQEESEAKLQKEIEKKNAEIKKATSDFSARLDKTKEQLHDQKMKTREAEKEIKVLKDLAKCETLLGMLESNYEEICIILKRFKRSYPQHCTEIETALANVLKAMEKRANIKAVS